MKTQFIKSKKFLVAILIISLIANAYLFREVYVAKKMDTVVALNHYHKWETKLQVYTGYLGRVLESSEEESYYRMLGTAEDIRTFKTVPGAHYYGRKNVEEFVETRYPLTGVPGRQGVDRKKQVVEMSLYS